MSLNLNSQNKNNRWENLRQIHHHHQHYCYWLCAIKRKSTAARSSSTNPIEILEIRES